ncbi:MAG TPA: alpha/beta hydrolase [Prolixibacteraceae bacterium]|nr:alpha/beta hydrolase [Prolixibacteraceae bacterium]
MKTYLPILLFALLLPLAILAQPRVLPLWEKGAPGFESRKDTPEQAKDYWVKSIHNPSLTVFMPEKNKANGCAVVIAPGGGFRELVYDAEGRQAAEFLNSIGVTAFVLKYRLPGEEGSPYTPEHVRQDAYRALRLVRSKAGEFNIDPSRVGMLGFSAGGAVIMMVAFDKGDGNPSALDPIDQLNGRPDFVMMVYPGGKAPEKIASDAPPAFLLCANDDEYGCDEVTMELLQKFRSANVPVEAILLARGKHAFNMGDRSTLVSVNTWPNRMADWMADSGWLRK